MAEHDSIPFTNQDPDTELDRRLDQGVGTAFDYQEHTRGRNTPPPPDPLDLETRAEEPTRQQRHTVAARRTSRRGGRAFPSQDTRTYPQGEESVAEPLTTEQELAIKATLEASREAAEKRAALRAEDFAKKNRLPVNAVLIARGLPPKDTV